MEQQELHDGNIYEPPKAKVLVAQSDVERASVDWGRSARRAGAMFLAGWAMVLLTFPAALLGPPRLPVCTLGAATALFAFAAVRAVAALRWIFRASRPRPLGVGILVLVFPLVGGILMTVASALSTMFALVGGRRGRQVRHFGRPVLATTVPNGDQATDRRIASVPEALRGPIAARWRVNARTEHASVAAFANLTLALLAVGAPSKLVEAAQRDGEDETRHAELCFALAGAIDGEAHRAGPFPQAARVPRRFGGRAWILSALAIDSLVDGALHEGVSGRVLAQLAKACEEPAVKEVLQRLAVDEARHAAHGWAVVEWCVAEGGAPVMAALCGALAGLPDRFPERLPGAAMDGSWEHFGIPGEARGQHEYEVTKRRLTARVVALTSTRAAA